MDNVDTILDKNLLWLDNLKNVIDDSNLTNDKNREILSSLIYKYKSLFTEKPGKIKDFLANLNINHRENVLTDQI